MAAPPYQKFFWGSYHKHTAHLRDARDHGAYLLLLGALWNNEGKLPADDETLAAYAKLTSKEWASVKPKLMPLFTISRGKLTQDRVTEDLAKYRDTSGKRKEAGKAGGKASAGKRGENRQAIASDLPTKPEPESEPKEERSNDLFVVPATPTPTTERKVATVYPELFEAAWKAYPHVKGRSSKSETLERWKRLPPDTRQALPAAAAAYAREGREPKMDCGAQAMERWLKGGKYADWMGHTVPQGTDWPDSRWAMAVELWRTERSWGESLGPPPGQPGCRVPPHLMIQSTSQGSAA